MDQKFSTRLRHAWNAFTGTTQKNMYTQGYTYGARPDRVRLRFSNERSIIAAIYNRISIDVSSVSMRHVRVDENGRYLNDITSGLNDCLTIEANKDQSGRALIQDIALSLFDEGVVALVPVETTTSPINSNSYDVASLRTAKIVEWFPDDVRLHLYNDKTGKYENLVLPKKMVAIIENPLYAVMNEPNSTLKRLVYKLNMLDSIDEQSSSGKLDLIFQLPYTVKSPTRMAQAENRRKDIEMQLTGSKYGIAYVDATEKITQLNRPAENNLMAQIEYLTSMLYNQLGISEKVLEGSASEEEMLNYYNRTIEPILSAISEAMVRSFLTKTARTQGQKVMYFREPFKLSTTTQIAEIADTFIRNEILSANEMRAIIGFRPDDSVKSDELSNPNIRQEGGMMGESPEDPSGDLMNLITDYMDNMAVLDEIDNELDDVESSLGGQDMMHYASPYYDPVKAHEYYMQNRELKNRRSTSGLNEEGRKVAKYVRETIRTERKSNVETHKEQTKSQIDTLRETRKATVEGHKKSMDSKIEQLRSKLKAMSKEDKAANKDSVYSEISKLRDDNKMERQHLSEEFKEQSGALRDDHKQERTRLKEESDEKYIGELDKIKNTDQYKKKKKAKKGKKGKKTTKKAKTSKKK